MYQGICLKGSLLPNCFPSVASQLCFPALLPHVPSNHFWGRRRYNQHFQTFEHFNFRTFPQMICMYSATHVTRWLCAITRIRLIQSIYFDNTKCLRAACDHAYVTNQCRSYFGSSYRQGCEHVTLLHLRNGWQQRVWTRLTRITSVQPTINEIKTYGDNAHAFVDVCGQWFINNDCWTRPCVVGRLYTLLTPCCHPCMLIEYQSLVQATQLVSV